ncbi:hypothetical protein JCM8547_007373 [Rhodosporidiobolus lusitaniae]
MWPTLFSEIFGFGAATATPYSPRERFPPGSLDGKVFLVTGGHGGIGLSTTKFLCVAGARVIIASRTKSKVDKAIDELVAEHGEELRSRLSYEELDLCSLKQVSKCGDEVLRKESRLDGVALNAGIMAMPYKLTEDGVEQQFQTNHLGHWLLVQKLLPSLEKTADLTGHPSRVISVSSWAHNFISLYPFASLSYASLADVNRSYGNSMIRYSVSKLSNIYFANELNNGVTSGKVKALSLHPGFVASNLYDVVPLARPGLRFFINIDEGSYSSVYAVADPEVEEKKLWGEYLVPFCKVKEPRNGKDPVKQRELWELSEAICREKIGSW